MRQTISGLVAAIALVTASTVPALACGFGGCSPCGWAYGGPCAQAYVQAPAYSGCISGCGGWAYERLPDPVRQYYYVNQGPTYTGPGNFAPYPTYRESAVVAGPVIYSYRAHPHYRPWRGPYGHARYRYYGHHEEMMRRYN